jgi:hypothetical protein
MKKVFKKDFVWRIIGALMIIAATSLLTIHIQNLNKVKEGLYSSYSCSNVNEVEDFSYNYKTVSFGDYFKMDIPAFLKPEDLNKQNEELKKEGSVFYYSETYPFGDGDNYHFIIVNIYPLSGNPKISDMPYEVFDKGSNKKYFDSFSNYKDPENISTYKINRSDGGVFFETYFVINKTKDMLIELSVGEGPCFKKKSNYDHLIKTIEFI